MTSAADFERNAEVPGTLEYEPAQHGVVAYDRASDDQSVAQRWFSLAEQDLAAAVVLIFDGSVALRIAGFLAQQLARRRSKQVCFVREDGAQDPWTALRRFLEVA